MVTMTNAECIAELSDAALDHQIAETCKELRVLDRHTNVWDAAVEDLREMFAERRARRSAFAKGA